MIWFGKLISGYLRQFRADARLTALSDFSFTSVAFVKKELKLEF